ncbi:hypothetical protein PGTUg99_027812 [Puccinia graminis f. sp. tritici]|nr:hypothetical protein PGTUg99_027812 [Puccinia graminis f. sp. tritici]
MLSFNFFCHALPVISIIGPFVNAGFLPQEPVHFTRSSSVTESTTSSKTTSIKSFHSSVITQPAVVVRSFPLSQDGVNCQYRAFPQGHQGIQSNSYATGSAPSSRMVANLTPHNCHVRCTPPKIRAPRTWQLCTNGTGWPTKQNDSNLNALEAHQPPPRDTDQDLKVPELVSSHPATSMIPPIPLTLPEKQSQMPRLQRWRIAE